MTVFVSPAATSLAIASDVAGVASDSGGPAVLEQVRKACAEYLTKQLVKAWHAAVGWKVGSM